MAKTRECLAVTNCMTECDTASHVHCPSKDSQMFNFWGYLSHKLAQAKSSLLNIYERQRFSCSPSLYKQRLANGHLLREHIDVQYFFVMWVVKYRFHLVGQITTSEVTRNKRIPVCTPSIAKQQKCSMVKRKHKCSSSMQARAHSNRCTNTITTA